MSKSKHNTDPGLAAVDLLFRDMMVDEAWAVRRDRGFTWWSYRLAQHVEATPPFQAPDGAQACCIRVWTDLVMDDPDETKTPSLLSITNIQESMSALVWDPERGVISESFTSVVYDDTVRGWAGMMTTAAVLQNTAAHSRAHAVAEALDGRVASSEHPASGERPEMDDLLNVPADVIASEGAGPSRFAGTLMRRLAATDPAPWLIANGDETSFTAEVHYSSDLTAAEAAALNETDGPGTALLQVDTGQPHPQLGSGSLITLKLPVEFGPGDAPVVANELNRLEAAGQSNVTMMGAWCLDPGDEDSLAFVSFVPSVLAQPGVLENMVAYDSVRARWVCDVLR